MSDLDALMSADAVLDNQVTELDAAIKDVKRSALNARNLSKKVPRSKENAETFDDTKDGAVNITEDSNGLLSPLATPVAAAVGAAASSSGRPPSPQRNADRLELHRTKTKIRTLAQDLESAKTLSKRKDEQLEEVKRTRDELNKKVKTLTDQVRLLTVAERKRANNPPKAARAQSPEEYEAIIKQLEEQLKKADDTAARIAREKDDKLKAKDQELKRAVERHTKVQTQLDDARIAGANGGAINEESELLDRAKSRIKQLERHREDLIDAFRKQMKLIDILKRQKVHVEAARLLQFVEEDFMFCLDIPSLERTKEWAEEEKPIVKVVHIVPPPFK